ncbi:unnamed protein product [Choristocarpus tenellus]
MLDTEGRPLALQDQDRQGSLVQARSSVERHVNINGTSFKIPERYGQLRAVGKGSYGVVCSAVDQQLDENVAIKKITPMAAHRIDAKHVLREVRVMRHLGVHENIITLKDLFCREVDDELYIVMELLESDLHRVIHSSQVLTDQHHCVFMLQLLRGVQFLHENNIIHRDLKPGNLLVTRHCELRISDFGLARAVPGKNDASCQEEDSGEAMTEHVVTRWYRPPELMLSPNGFYDFSVDIWSVGCIFAELIGRRPLFPGGDFVHQLALIFDVVGAPLPDEVSHIRGSQARKFLAKLNSKPGRDMAEVLPTATREAVSLLQKMLCFDPQKRLRPEEGLLHKYFESICDEPQLSVEPPNELNFDFERGLSREELRELILEEICQFPSGEYLRSCQGMISQEENSSPSQVDETPEDQDNLLLIKKNTQVIEGEPISLQPQASSRPPGPCRSPAEYGAEVIAVSTSRAETTTTQATDTSTCENEVPGGVAATVTELSQPNGRKVACQNVEDHGVAAQSANLGWDAIGNRRICEHGGCGDGGGVTLPIKQTDHQGNVNQNDLSKRSSEQRSLKVLPASPLLNFVMDADCIRSKGAFNDAISPSIGICRNAKRGQRKGLSGRSVPGRFWASDDEEVGVCASKYFSETSKDKNNKETGIAHDGGHGQAGGGTDEGGGGVDVGMEVEKEQLDGSCLGGLSRGKEGQVARVVDTWSEVPRASPMATLERKLGHSSALGVKDFPLKALGEKVKSLRVATVAPSPMTGHTSRPGDIQELGENKDLATVPSRFLSAKAQSSLQICPRPCRIVADNGLRNCLDARSHGSLLQARDARPVGRTGLDPSCSAHGLEKVLPLQVVQPPQVPLQSANVTKGCFPGRIQASSPTSGALLSGASSRCSPPPLLPLRRVSWSRERKGRGRSSKIWSSPSVERGVVRRKSKLVGKVSRQGFTEGVEVVFGETGRDVSRRSRSSKDRPQERVSGEDFPEPTICQNQKSWVWKEPVKTTAKKVTAPVEAEKTVATVNWTWDKVDSLRRRAAAAGTDEGMKTEELGEGGSGQALSEGRKAMTNPCQTQAKGVHQSGLTRGDLLQAEQFRAIHQLDTTKRKAMNKRTPLGHQYSGCSSGSEYSILSRERLPPILSPTYESQKWQGSNDSTAVGLRRLNLQTSLMDDGPKSRASTASTFSVLHSAREHGSGGKGIKCEEDTVTPLVGAFRTSKTKAFTTIFSSNAVVASTTMRQNFGENYSNDCGRQGCLGGVAVKSEGVATKTLQLPKMTGREVVPKVVPWTWGEMER